MESESSLFDQRIISKLKNKLKIYENMDVNPPKGREDFKTISEYDYLNKIKTYVIARVPLMIVWLETGELPELIFDETIRVGSLLNDMEILKLEEAIIKAQLEKNNSSRIA